jgi:hypothetical protein
LHWPAIIGFVPSLTHPGAFSLCRLPQDVQDQGYVPLDLEIEHTDANKVGPILEGIGES